MKKEIRCLIYAMIGIICMSIICLVIIGVTDKQKECKSDTTTETTAKEIITTTEETVVEETTIEEEPTTEELTVKETTTKVLTTKEMAAKEATVEETTKKEHFDYVNCDVPSNNTMKTYMDYRAITLTTSRQYKLQETLAYTGDNGLRMVNGRYCVAVGSYYTTTIGQHIDIELENGKVIKAVLADCKADKHTDSTNRIHPDGSVVEFVVDTDALDSTAKRMGDISYVNGWNSKVVNIKVYDTVEKF